LLQNRAARRIGQRRKGGIQQAGFIVNHMVKFREIARSCQEGCFSIPVIRLPD
jgi:hypothetical protein